MLTSHTSFSEEKTLYLRELARHTRNNNEGLQLLEDTADQHAFHRKLWEFQTSPILPFPSHPPDWSLNPPRRNSSTASAEKFYYSFYYNEGLEYKLTRAPFLGLAKSIY